jgi:predicted ATPase
VTAEIDRLVVERVAELAEKHGVPRVHIALAWLLQKQPLATGLELREASSQPLSKLLVQELRSKRLLLLLDNCEHLIDACRQLAEQLLRACSGLTILATSREVLNIAGERVWHVPTLSTPGVDLAAPELLMSYEGIRLFVERAGAANPEFALTERNALAVAQICRRLSGIPLALELAAARVRHMVPEAIAARLDNCFSLLTAGSRTALPRQQTLRATIDWSYELLTEPERVLFRRLAVFAGGFTLQAAEAVCEIADIRLQIADYGDQSTIYSLQSSILELLSQLLDKSLLIAERRNDTTRYRLLDTMRAYAHERLMASGEADALRDRHLACFIRLAEQAEPHLFSADQVAWLDHLAIEHDNLRAALDWSLERADAYAALRLVTALRSFWYTRGHYDEGRRRTLQVLAMPTAQVRTSARASALNAAGAILWASGDAAEARPLLEEALAIGREVGDEWNAGWALLHMGTIAYQLGDYGAARPLLEAGLASCRGAGAAGRRGVGWGLIFLGDLALHAGETEQARSRFAESVALLRELSDHALMAYPLRRLGHLALQHGDFATATAYCAESLRLNLAIDDRLAVAACLVALAAVAVAVRQVAGDAAQTEDMWHAARLCGAVTAQLAIIGAPLWPADAAMLNATIATATAHLGEGAFAAAAAEGRTIPLDQLIERGADRARPDGVETTAPTHHLPV